MATAPRPSPTRCDTRPEQGDASARPIRPGMGPKLGPPAVQVRSRHLECRSRCLAEPLPAPRNLRGLVNLRVNHRGAGSHRLSGPDQGCTFILCPEPEVKDGAEPGLDGAQRGPDEASLHNVALAALFWL